MIQIFILDNTFLFFTCVYHSANFPVWLYGVTDQYHITLTF